MEQKYNISAEVLTRYVAGTASLEEIALVAHAINEDPDIRNLVDIMGGLSKSGFLEENHDLPMSDSAAATEGNLCDVLCERYILQEYTGNDSSLDYLGEFKKNSWIKESGTPLYNIGRLLEKNGFEVNRKYECCRIDLESALEDKLYVIAVVDYGQLWYNQPDGVFHAVVCLGLSDETVRIYDPAADDCKRYSVDVFERAWSCSRNYLVCASPSNMEYIPHPIDVSDVQLDDALLELTESIAENAHEVWAEQRRKEGWTYGPNRDDITKKHPDMVPYSRLDEGEKDYDRVMAFNTLRLVKKLGFTISRRYTLYCPRCGEFVDDGMNFCPHCGGELK